MISERGNIAATYTAEGAAEAQKIRNTTNVNAKFISDETFLEKRKRYFGTFIFEKMLAFPISEPMPPFVASLKKENTMLPQKR